MVDMERQEIIQGDKTEKIKNWLVFFMCPFGVTPDAEQAAKFCKSIDMDPRLAIIPVPVAKGETLEEVVGGLK